MPPPADLDEDGYKAYPVERILDSRLFRGRTLQYLVKWTGYEQPQWEPWDNVAGAPVRLANYHTENPGRVGEDSWLENQNISDSEESTLEMTEDGSESDWDPDNNDPGENHTDISLNAVDFKGLVGAFGPKEGVLSELQHATPLATPNPQHRPDNT